MTPLLESLRHGLIVSCQAISGNPLHDTGTMPLMAMAAEKGGAKGIRANGQDDIRAIKAATKLPVIGIYKTEPSADSVYITPTFEAAKLVADAGADVIALDATARPRPDGVPLGDLIRRIKAELGKAVMADISVFDEGVAAARIGCDLVATTLSGYTAYSQKMPGPDFELIARLAAETGAPIVAEGRLWTHDDVREALTRGAFAVVIGKAITNPMAITKKFVEAIDR